MTSKIVEGLQHLAVAMADVHEDPANARKGHAVDRIAASLKQYGQRKPIVVNRGQGNKIEAGNGTYRAARSLGWTEIAVVFVDDDPATAAGYGIADNRLGDLSEWDVEALGAALATVDDLFTGFTTAEIDDLISDGDEAPANLDPGDGRYQEQYGVIVICEDEQQQEAVYNDLKEAGYQCRVVVT